MAIVRRGPTTQIITVFRSRFANKIISDLRIARVRRLVVYVCVYVWGVNQIDFA